jgi:hypothetical protein
MPAKGFQALTLTASNEPQMGLFVPQMRSTAQLGGKFGPHWQYMAKSWPRPHSLWTVMRHS